MLKPLLTVASVYLAAIAIAVLLVPAQFGVNAVPDDPSPQLLALLRQLGGPLLGVALLDWLWRSVEASALRHTVLLANLVGFGAVAVNDIVGVSTGDARDLSRVFLVVHVAFTVAFAVAWVRCRRPVARDDAGTGLAV